MTKYLCASQECFVNPLYINKLLIHNIFNSRLAVDDLYQTYVPVLTNMNDGQNIKKNHSKPLESKQKQIETEKDITLQGSKPYQRRKNHNWLFS